MTSKKQPDTPENKNDPGETGGESPAKAPAKHPGNPSAKPSTPPPTTGIPYEIDGRRVSLAEYRAHQRTGTRRAAAAELRHGLGNPDVVADATTADETSP